MKESWPDSNRMRSWWFNQPADGFVWWTDEEPEGRWLRKRRAPAPPWASPPDGWIRRDCGSSASAGANRPPRRRDARNRWLLWLRHRRPTSTTPTRPASTRWCSLCGRPDAAPTRRRDAVRRWWCGRTRLPPPDAPATSVRTESNSNDNKKINVIIDSRIIHQISNESSGLMPRGRRQRRSAIVSFHQHHGTAGNMRPDESDGYLEVGVLHHVLGPHPVEDELGFVGHANDVILHGVRQEPNTNRTRLKSTTSATNYHPIRNQSGELPAFVDELDEGEPGVLLQWVLPLLRAEQHDQLYDRLALLEGEEALAFEQQLLAVRPQQRLGEERCEVDHDLAQERAHRAQGRLQLLRQRCLSRHQRRTAQRHRERPQN